MDAKTLKEWKKQEEGATEKDKPHAMDFVFEKNRVAHRELVRCNAICRMCMGACSPMLKATNLASHNSYF